MKTKLGKTLFNTWRVVWSHNHQGGYKDFHGKEEAVKFEQKLYDKEIQH